MKILWFTLTPCGASEQLKLDSQGGGWLSSLEKQLTLSNQVELHICFQWNDDIPSFKYNNTYYHPVPRIRMKNKLIGRLVGSESQQNTIQYYTKVISNIKPDLIHVHGTEEDFGLIQTITDIPVVISIQGILSNYVYKYFSGISFARIFFSEKIYDHLRLRSIISNYYIFKDNAKREKKILSLAKHVIGRTDWDRRSTKVLAPNALYYKGDEILRSPFYEMAWSRQQFNKPLKIVTVSSIAAYKGFETILRVSSILQQQVNFDFSWSVIGLSPKDPIVKISSRWIGTSSKVHLLGIRTGNEIKDILLESDIYCQVSHIENSPNSLCEAMLLGMPIVASYAGGTDSILSNHKEGLLVQDGDPYSMAGAILELYQDAVHAAQLGGAARVKAYQRHNPDKIARDLLAVYNKITSDH